jgi:hypothetical protein
MDLYFAHSAHVCVVSFHTHNTQWLLPQKTPLVCSLWWDGLCSLWGGKWITKYSLHDLNELGPCILLLCFHSRGQSVWDLWQIMWHCDTSVFPCHYYSTIDPYSSSSTRCSFQKDKRAKTGRFPIELCSFRIRGRWNESNLIHVQNTTHVGNEYKLQSKILRIMSYWENYM